MESFLGTQSLGEESLQMWNLNKRLEAYLARVKYLEEENELLKAEIQTLKVSPVENSWRGKYEEQMAALRTTLDEAFREKYVAELARDNLYEEVQQVKSRCQKERAAQEEAKKLLSLSKQELEEEKRTHLWLWERASQLEKEVEALVEAHEEERAGLDREVAGFSWSLEGFRAAPAPFQPVEVEDYSKKLSSIWRGAVETYKTEVSQLEASLGEAKENLWKATEGNRQNQLQLQQLKKELAGLKFQKEMLEQSLSQQWQNQQGEAEKLQLAIEALEEEKRSLRVQITQILEDRQQLMHLKMSLSLEVATYRTLLETESTRLQMPATDYNVANGLRDAKLETSNSKLQAVSLDRGRLGSRDLRPSPSTFLKGNMKSRLPKNQNKSFTVNLASMLPKSRSPVTREFQKANTVLQSQSTKSFDGSLLQKDIPAFVDPPAFKLGSSQVITATKVETVSQSFFHESSLPVSSVSPAVPDVLKENSSNTEQRRLQKGGQGRDETAIQLEGGGDTATQLETEEMGEKEELYEYEEGEQPSEEPPGKTTTQNVPYPTQLVTEALEIALKEVNEGDVCFESVLLNVPPTQNGVLSGDALSMEEDNGADSSLSIGVLEETVPRLHKDEMEDSQLMDLPEDAKDSEVSVEVNGSREVCAEQPEGEIEVWVTRDVESSHETELLEEERSFSTRQNKEEIVADAPIIGKMASDKETRFSEENEGDDEQPPILQSVELSDDLEVTKCTELTHHPGQATPATLTGEKESWEPSTSHRDEQPGATGGDLEETDGGAEDLEVMSTEALHLSEDEERRESWSPSRENEEYDFQAETLESELLQMEEFAIENLSPLSHPALSGESCQEHLFLGVEQENLEEKGTPLYETDATMSEEEEKEMVLETKALCFAMEAEEAILREEISERNEENIVFADEPRVIESTDAEEEHGGKLREDTEQENALDNEDMIKEDISDKEAVNLQDETHESDTILQDNVLGQESAKEGQTEETGEASQGQLVMGQKVEGEESTKASSEASVDNLKREDSVMGTEATETESEEKVGILEKEEIMDHVSTNDLQNKENLPQCDEAKPEVGTSALQTEEQQVDGEKEDNEKPPSQQITTLEQCTVDEARKASQEQSDSINELEAKDHSSSQAHIEMPSGSDRQLQSDYSGSEDSLESLDTSLNPSCETDESTKELESSKQIILEETLPDHTPLYMYDGQMLAVTGKCQMVPESEEAAETFLLTKDRTISLEDTQQTMKEQGPCSSEAEENKEQVEIAKILESTEEEGGSNTAFALNQAAEGLPMSKDLEDAQAETLDNADLRIIKHEMPRGEECFAQLDAESSEQLGGTFKQETPVAKDLEEAKTETSKLIEDNADLHTIKHEMPREEERFMQLDTESDEQSGETSNQEPAVSKDLEAAQAETLDNPDLHTIKHEMPREEECFTQLDAESNEQSGETSKQEPPVLKDLEEAQAETSDNADLHIIKHEMLSEEEHFTQLDAESDEQSEKTSKQEPPVLKDLEEAEAETSDNADLHTIKHEMPREEECFTQLDAESNEQSGETSKQEPPVSKDLEEAQAETSDNADLHIIKHEMLSEEEHFTQLDAESDEQSGKTSKQEPPMLKDLEEDEADTLDNADLHTIKHEMPREEERFTQLDTESNEQLGEETFKQEPPVSKDLEEAEAETSDNADLHIIKHEMLREEECFRQLDAESDEQLGETSKQQPPVSKDLEGGQAETSELIGDSADLHTIKHEMPGQEESFAQLDVESDKQSGEIFKQVSNTEKEPRLGELLHEEASGMDIAWELEMDTVFQADQVDPSSTQEGVCVENDSPLEFSDPSNLETEGTHKVSPLTSVADLGEIVLEGELSPDVQKDDEESQSVAYYEDESLPFVHESQQITDLGNGRREDSTQQRDLAEGDPNREDVPDPSPEAVVNISIESMKDSDILEIVEQALEFNQELIKAVERDVEMEQPATDRDEHSSQEEYSHCTSVGLSDTDESQILTGILEASSPSAKDTTGFSHLWVENNENGLQPDPSLTDLNEEILNGIGDLHPGNVAYDVGTAGEELIKKVIITQQFHEEELNDFSVRETISQSPLANEEEAPQTGEDHSEAYERVSPGHRGQEALDSDERIFADIIQTACMKGKDAELETISTPPHFGDEVLRLEASQQLKFRPEDNDELWSSEDN
ncbi:nestin [Hemicordylus capensis]|uniref:nestin n=1 Tax=Hemicordylus capensis TaxID=884348 RepID=UPI0023033F55|nr:nestin [Hemicordylus capensis]